MKIHRQNIFFIDSDDVVDDQYLEHLLSMKKWSLDMKVYAFFLKIRMIRPYIFIARKMNW